MAGDPIKLDQATHLRDLTAQAADVFDQINAWLVRNARYGYIPDAPGKSPDDPITDADFAGTAHAGVTAAQLYGTVAFFAGMAASIDTETAKLLARFGKPMGQQ